MAMTPASRLGSRERVPWRTIWATIVSVLGAVVAIVIVQKLTHIIGLLVVAAFFAILLTPAVDFLGRHGMRRSLATIVVFLVALGLIVGMMVAFIQPIVREVNQFVNDFPQFVENARQGRGTIGRLVQRYNVDEYIVNNQAKLQTALRQAGAPALDVARSVASGVFAFVTVLVLTVLMVLESPKLTSGFLNIISERLRDRVRRVAADCSKAVTGYMVGNLVISAVAGIATFLFLTVAGVPFAGVLGLWVAFADLIPLVGATLGAIPTVLVAFLSSPTRGIATIIFYAVYQQIENHILQPTIMSRTVNMNPLAVLVSVLIGVELFGILGALLAIPAAGIIQVIVRDLWDERQGRLKPSPSIGASETPLTTVEAGEPTDGGSGAETGAAAKDGE
jgi:predicted PurR-regulated permease PerM